MEGNWITIGASVIGRSHIANGLPCQDAHQVKIIDQDCLIITVSDGAGSCENSATGSKLVTEYCIEQFESLIRQKIVNKSYDNWKADSINALLSVRKRLETYAAENDISLKSLSATCIVLIVIGNKIYTTHIGDGRAGYRDSLGKWSALITPYSGQYINETIFITSAITANPEEYIKSNVIEEDFDAVTVITDGAESICWEYATKTDSEMIIQDPNTPFSGFFDPVILSIKTMMQNNLSLAAINQKWEAYIDKGQEKIAMEPDDKTIVIALKE